MAVLYTFGATPTAVVTDKYGNVQGDWPLSVLHPDTTVPVSVLFEADGTTPIDQLRTNSATGAAPGAIREFRTNIPQILYSFLDVDGNPVTWFETSREIATEALTLASNAIPKQEKAQASGVATLDADTLVPVAQLPDLSGTYILLTQKAVADGVATLDDNGLVPTEQIPPLSELVRVITQDSGTIDLSGSGTAESPLTANGVRPWLTQQASSPTTWQTSGEFTNAQWPYLTFTAPASGAVKITLSGNVQNTNTTTSSAWLGWHFQGDLPAMAWSDNAISTVGSRLMASRTIIVTGLTSGTSYTLIPRYQFSSVGSSSATSANNGMLIVEPISAPSAAVTFTIPARDDALFPENGEVRN